MNLKQVSRNAFTTLNRRERWQMLSLAVSELVVSVFDIAFLMALLFIVDFYTSGSLHKFPFLLYGHPLLLIVSFFILFGIKNYIGFVVSRNEYVFVYDVASRLSKDNLKQYLNGPFTEQVNVDSSVATRKIMQQPIEFSHYVVNGMQQVFGQFILITVTLVAVCIVNPMLLLFLLLIFLPPLLFISGYLKRRLHESRVHEKIAGERAIQHLREALSGYVEGNVYAKQDFFTERYHRFQRQLNGYLAQRLAIQSMPGRMMEVFAVFALLVLIFANYFAASKSLVSVSTVGTLMVAAYKIIPGIVKITNAISQIKSYGFASVGLAVNNNTDTEKGVCEPISSISFENVAFAYPSKKVLDNFSMCLRRGDMMVMMGKSGLGKTTIVNLLLGFMEPRAGDIRVNGIRHDHKGMANFRRQIAYVKQQAFILHASIKENIALQEHDYHESRLENATRIAGVSKIADSLEAVIKEDGKNFSGGQRQRIALARALYKEFDLIILDEPFNELDEYSEHQLLTELRNIADHGKMVLLITHNPAALNYCNKKILLDD